MILSIFDNIHTKKVTCKNINFCFNIKYVYTEIDDQNLNYILSWYLYELKQSTSTSYKRGCFRISKTNWKYSNIATSKKQKEPINFIISFLLILIAEIMPQKGTLPTLNT